MRFLATYIMQGRMQAIMVASSCALLSIVFPPVGIVSSASVALVTLRRGATEGCYILVCACLASALLGIFLIGSYQFPVLYGLTFWAPVWLFAVILREGRHLFLAIEIVIFLAGFLIVGAYLYQPQLADFWQSLLNEPLETMLVKANPQTSLQTIRHSLSVFYHFVITGLVAQIYVMTLLAGLFFTSVFSFAEVSSVLIR